MGAGHRGPVFCFLVPILKLLSAARRRQEPGCGREAPVGAKGESRRHRHGAEALFLSPGQTAEVGMGG